MRGVPRVRRLTVAALTGFALAVAPLVATPASADPSVRDPIVVLAYYSSRDLPGIAKAIEQADLPNGTPIFYGNYQGTAPPSKPGKPHPHPPPPHVTIPHGRVAPILGWTHNKFWDTQRLKSSEHARLKGDSRAMTGGAPSLASLLGGGSSRAYGWGREIGRRFRDRLRQQEAGGKKFGSWQFDEIPTTAALGGRRGRTARSLVRGMLDGSADGRLELGDRHWPGIVFMANATLALSVAHMTSELKRFWASLNRDTAVLVGEEYPKFLGDPSHSAFVQSGGQRAMAARGGALASLASKYVVGITPGYKLAHGLGGNVKGRNADGVNAWRARFLQARAQFGTAGFAAYNLQHKNGSSRVLGPLLQAFGDALRSTVGDGK